MITLDWRVFAYLVLALAILKGIVSGIMALYVTIYKTSYTLGRSTMEQEDTRQLLKVISEVRAEYPESELALVMLWSKLVGEETKKVEEKAKVIGFNKPEVKKEEKNA